MGFTGALIHHYDYARQRRWLQMRTAFFVFNNSNDDAQLSRITFSIGLWCSARSVPICVRICVCLIENASRCVSVASQSRRCRQFDSFHCLLRLRLWGAAIRILAQQIGGVSFLAWGHVVLWVGVDTFVCSSDRSNWSVCVSKWAGVTRICVVFLSEEQSKVLSADCRNISVRVRVTFIILQHVIFMFCCRH